MRAGEEKAARMFMEKLESVSASELMRLKMRPLVKPARAAGESAKTLA